MDSKNLTKAAVAEFLGPFALVFAGVGAIIMTQGSNLVAIALAHGLAIGLMITAVGHVSGGHFNPAVTIAMLATKKISVQNALVYIVAQLLGAIAAAALLTTIFPDLGGVGRNNLGVNNGVPAVHPEVTTVGAFILEVILTFFLVWVIFGVAVDWRSNKSITGLAIGLTITMDIFAGGAISGAVMNPARAIGPAVIQGDFTNIWIWILAPIVGGLIAGLVYQYVILDNVTEDPTLGHVVAKQVDPIDSPTDIVPRTAPKRRSSRR